MDTLSRRLKQGPHAVCCAGCGIPLGVQVGRTLVVGAVRVLHRVRMLCFSCGHRQDWTPPDPSLRRRPGKILAREKIFSLDISLSQGKNSSQ